MAAITVTDLRKHYGDIRAVDGLSFSVNEGEVYALLGENGAGKSTTVEILEGHRRATSGAVSVLGYDPALAEREFRNRIGVVLQSSGVEVEFTVREVVELYAGVYRSHRTLDDVIGLVGLDGQVDQRVGSLSGGQRRRVDLALGIVGRPDLLFLDEPTTGFDPSARRKSWDLVESLCDDGVTVLLTTHYLDEAEHLADRVGVLANGNLIAEGTPDELIAGISGTVVSFMLPDSIAPADAVATLGPVLAAEVRLSGRLVEVSVDRPTAVVHRATGWAVERGIELEGLTVKRASLEDVYLQLVERNGSTSSDASHVNDSRSSVNDFPSNVSLVLRQTIYQLKFFTRVPVALFFTVLLPMIMLVLFNALFGNNTVTTPEGTWAVRQFYTGGLAAYTAVSATYSNLANMVPIRRDEGVLKRWRSTPLPTWAYIAGFIGSAIVIAFVGVVLMLTMGVVLYDLSIDWAKMPAAFVTFLVGVASFAALGMALAALIRSASSAAAAANATILPLAFISDVFVVTEDAPSFLTRLGDMFPLKPFVNAFQGCFNPLIGGSGFDWSALAFVAAWGAVGAVIAVKKFTWEPSGAGRRGRRPRAAADA